MAKLDDLLDELSGYLTGARPAPEPDRIQKLLQQRNPYAVAKAAACAAQFGMKDLTALLQSCFEKTISDTKGDQGCIAKKAVIKALDELVLEDSEWFIRAARVAQWEPVMGGRRDSAIDVRCTALQAFCRFEWYKVSHALIERLGDSEAKVRMTAVNVIAAFSGREAEMIILTKISCGDPVSEVMGECFRALNAMETSDRLDILTGLLKSENEAVGLEAAFAIGESKLPEGFKVLSDEWDSTIDFEKRKILLLAISTLRTPEALHFLEELKEDRQYRELVEKALLRRS